MPGLFILLGKLPVPTALSFAPQQDGLIEQLPEEARTGLCLCQLRLIHQDSAFP
jgi:hypothetical protein